MRLRPYQSDAVEAALEHLREHFSSLIVLPTGAGKTVVFTEIARRWATGRVLILAHREELVTQAADKVAEALGERPGIEMAESRCEDGMFGGPAVVVGSVQSVCRPNRLARLDPEDFGLLIVDEAHHATPQNGSYHAIIEHFKKNQALKLLGVTATPDRSDRLSLGQVFESVAYEMSILDAIEGGWLVPVEQQFVRVKDLDFSQVRTTAGDLNEGDLDALLNQDGGRLLHEIAAATVDAAADEPTLIFANSVGSADAIAKIISRYPDKEAVCLHGGTPKEERRYELKRFADGGYQFLVGCDLFLEGFDSPRISVVANAKPTKSRSRYTQTVGRGTRLHPSICGAVNDLQDAAARCALVANSAKPRCLVLDFVGNSGKHRLISTADILGGAYAPAAVLRAVAEATASGRPADMRDALKNAERKIAEEDERRRKREEIEQRKRQEAERRKREEEERRRLEWLRGRAQYETVSVDPFGATGGGGSNAGGLGRAKQPTFKMLDLLRRNGVDITGLTFGEAAAEIERLKQFWSGQACSPKQAKLLKDFGENPSSSRDVAKVLLDVISGRGWVPRDYKLTRDRWKIRKEPDGSFRPLVIDPDFGKIGISATFKTEIAAREFITRCLETEAAGVAA